ncbi:MAG: hypothetical protein ACTTIM_05685 [Campylobacter sp.]
MRKVFNSVMRPAFSMILAIIFIVVIATLGMLSLQLSAQSAKQTEHVFLREQADLLAMNAAELAILTMQRTQYIGVNNKDWINKVVIYYPKGKKDGDDWLLKATVDIDYMAFKILDGVKPEFNNAHNHFALKKDGKSYSAPNDNIAMLNITVESNRALIRDRIRIFRSTIQRP